MPNDRHRARNEARKRHYIRIIRLQGLEKLKMSRRMKKKGKKLAETYDKLFGALDAGGNMQIEKAYMQVKYGTSLMQAAHQAWMGRLLIGESVNIKLKGRDASGASVTVEKNIDLDHVRYTGRRMNPTEKQMEAEDNGTPETIDIQMTPDIMEWIKEHKFTDDELKDRRHKVAIMSMPIINHTALGAARMAHMRMPPPILAAYPPCNLPKPAKVEGESCQDVIDKGLKDICAEFNCPPLDPKRFDIEDISDKQAVSKGRLLKESLGIPFDDGLEVKISGSHFVPAVSDKIRIIMRDEDNKDNENKK